MKRRLRWMILLGALSALLPNAARALSFSTVVVDAGHGGHDGGCVWNGLIEKRLCLDVAKRLETALKKRGVRVVMTRRTDTFVKLEDRARIANRNSRSVFVSIHFNASRDKAISGMEVFYRSDRGKVLARSILRSMDNRLIGKNRGVIHGGFKVLRSTLMPAVVVEAAYLSNKTEAGRYSSPANRQALADAIAAGIIAARG
ncbi:MAG: N-acetylmuramoyl-L-alanine amidase [Prosthecobacter sp.]|nr:N-acetylmuramoyl-L-alanine amidase [Prosthecobacter sp.]